MVLAAPTILPAQIASESLDLDVVARIRAECPISPGWDKGGKKARGCAVSSQTRSFPLHRLDKRRIIVPDVVHVTAYPMEIRVTAIRLQDLFAR